MFALFAALLFGDTLFLADRAWQVETKGRVGVRVRDGKIIFVGEAAVAPREGANVVDLGKVTLLPGLNDAHFHLAGLGRDARLVDLRDAKNASDAAAKVAAALKAHPDANVIEGRGWDQNKWPGQQMPGGDVLDRVSKKVPIVLTRVDGHAIWGNSAAFPSGGVLIDTEMEKALAKFPRASQEEAEANLLEGQRRALAVGLTAVADMGIDEVTLAAYRKLVASGQLTLRVHGALAASDEAVLERELPLGSSEKGRLSVRAVKIYADGALGSRGAKLLAPYEDAKTSGLYITEPAALTALVARVAAAGFQPCVHAIGDAAVRATLDAFAALSPELRAKVRPRVEHAQVVTLPDLDRFGPLTVIASMQPVHWTSDSPWAEKRVGKTRMQGAYALKPLADRKVQLAFGSDAPVESPSPWFGLKAAIDRGLTPAQAIDGFTRGAAFAAFAEKEAGALQTGMRADFTVLEGTLEEALAAPGKVRASAIIAGERR